MLNDTLEIRWFPENFDPRQAMAMVRRASGFEPVAEETRTDRYLRLPLSDGIGIKLRGGRIEHKWLYHRLPGIEPTAPLDRLGCWRKWSMAVTDDIAIPDPENWVAVRKQRWTSPWTWSEGCARALPRKTERENRCDVEVARVTIERPRSSDAFSRWTMCFESEGPDRQPLLESVLRIFQLSGLPKLLEKAEPQDYPGWLREHASC